MAKDRANDRLVRVPLAEGPHANHLSPSDMPAIRLVYRRTHVGRTGRPDSTPTRPPRRGRPQPTGIKTPEDTAAGAPSSSLLFSARPGVTPRYGPVAATDTRGILGTAAELCRLPRRAATGRGD